MFFKSKKEKERLENERREKELDELVIEAFMPIFPPTELRDTYPGGPEVEALAYCYVKGHGWPDITPREINRSCGRIYRQYVSSRGRKDEPIFWTREDVLRRLCRYK